MMKRYSLLFGLLVLIACGQSDIDTGQQASPERRLITVTGVPENFTGGTLEPIAIPVKTDGGLLIDAAAGRPPPDPFVVTMAETVTITLSHPSVLFAQETYRLHYNPDEWIRLVDVKEVPYTDLRGPYPEGGWVLKPMKPTHERFFSAVTLFIHDEGPPDCATCPPNSITRTYGFQIDPAK